MLLGMSITLASPPTMPASLAALIERLDAVRLTGRREAGSEAVSLSIARYTDL